MHDEAALAIEDITGDLVARIWAAQSAQFLALLHVSRPLQGIRLDSFLDKFVEFFYALHHMVAMEECAALVLCEAVADALSDSDEQPGVTEIGLSDTSTEECMCQTARQMAIQMVSLVYLIRSE